MTECNTFIYKNEYYRQKLGMFMGSSLAPVLVGRAIEALEKLNFRPIFWFTYVDDHLTYIPRNQKNNLLEASNSFNIQFTIEKEKENTINFLNMTVIHSQNKLITKCYSKEIASNRILNYYLAHPKHTIKYTAQSFIEKVFDLSHKRFTEENKKLIFDILEKNSFPSKYVYSKHNYIVTLTNHFICN